MNIKIGTASGSVTVTVTGRSFEASYFRTFEEVGSRSSAFPVGVGPSSGSGSVEVKAPVDISLRSTSPTLHRIVIWFSNHLRPSNYEIRPLGWSKLDFQNTRFDLRVGSSSHFVMGATAVAGSQLESQIYEPRDGE